MSYNKDSRASHRLKFACSHNSHLVPQRKTEQNPLKKSLLIHKSLYRNVSHYCFLCLRAKSAALKQKNMKRIIADHTILTTTNKCLKSCSLQWREYWRSFSWIKNKKCWVQGLSLKRTSGEDQRITRLCLDFYFLLRKQIFTVYSCKKRVVILQNSLTEKNTKLGYMLVVWKYTFTMFLQIVFTFLLWYSAAFPQFFKTNVTICSGAWTGLFHIQ